MQQYIETKKKFLENRWFYGFITIHVVAWTTLAAWFSYTLPMDALEGAMWGRQLAWGYDKDPFLNAWLTELAIWLGGKSGWLVYLFAQICVALCFWAVWRLARKFLSPVYAFIAVVILEGVLIYQGVDFDDNLLQIAFWALLILSFYNALQVQKIRYWVLVGVFAGLAVVSKYFVLMLFIPMGLFLLCNAKARISFLKPGIYIAAIIGFIICLPHIVWLFHHDFLTLQYSFGRVSASPRWWQHITNPLSFLWTYILTFILPTVLFSVLYIGRKYKASPIIAERAKIVSFNWQFLLWMSLGPLIAVLLISLITGSRIHAGWGQSLVAFWGVVLVAALQPTITRRQFYRFIVVVAAIFILIFGLNIFANWKATNKLSFNYPGKKIAERAVNQWHQIYHHKLEYVVGADRTISAIISLYSDDRPAVYISADPKISFWIDENRLRRKGAVFVSKDSCATFPESWKKRFPRLTNFHIESFAQERHPGASPIRFCMAFLPPKAAWARYHNSTLGFSFRYPAYLTANDHFENAYNLPSSWSVGITDNLAPKRAVGRKIVSIHLSPLKRYLFHGQAQYYLSAFRVGVSSKPLALGNCAKAPSYKKPIIQKINGISFLTYQTVSAGMSQVAVTKTHAVIHHGLCYSLEFVWAGLDNGPAKQQAAWVKRDQAIADKILQSFHIKSIG